MTLKSQFFFESGPKPTPTKWRNPTVLGQEDSTRDQWSHLAQQVKELGEKIKSIIKSAYFII